MPKYRVEYHRVATQCGYLDIEAANEDEARKLADARVDTHEGVLEWRPEDYSVELQQLDVELLDEEDEG